MKKITILLFLVVSITAISQSKTTGVINLTSNMSANFTLNNSTSKVTLVLTGPSDRWFGLGLGVVDGFGMSDGDVLVYTTSLTDRNFVGKQSPANDSQDWTTINNTVASGIRTLTLERNLTNSDANDFQFPFASTNSIDMSWSKANNATNNMGSNHAVGFTTANFTTLGVEDFSLNATAVYPNPSTGIFYIKTKTNLSKVHVYSHSGALVKSVKVLDSSKELELNMTGLQTGVYFLELQNDAEKSWKKIVVN